MVHFNPEFMGADCGNPEAAIVGLGIQRPYDRVFLDDTEPVSELTPEALAHKGMVDKFTSAKTDYVFGRKKWQEFSATAEEAKTTFKDNPQIVARIQAILEDLYQTYETRD